MSHSSASGERAKAQPNAVHPGELLVFDLAQERYALPLDQVREVLPLARLTPLLAAPAGFAGMLRLRGALLPVVDLRQRLGFPPVAAQIGHCIIATQLGSGVAGLLVDGVREIAAAGDGPGPVNRRSSGDFVQQVTQASGQVIAVLNAEATVGDAMCRFLAAIMRQDGAPPGTPDGKPDPDEERHGLAARI